MPVNGPSAWKVLSVTTAPIPPATMAHEPSGGHVTLLFVKVVLSANAVTPSFSERYGPSIAWLASSTR